MTTTRTDDEFVDYLADEAEDYFDRSCTNLARKQLAAVAYKQCPDCAGDPKWRRDGAHGDLAPCDHTNAPTIGQMLREWQALTAIAERAWHSPACPKSAYEGRLLPCTCGLDAARAALQAVRS